MSTILDAIRKAEQQRNEDTVPSLEAIVKQKRAKGGGGSRKPGWLLWLALILVFATTGYLYRDTVKSTGKVIANRVAGKSQVLMDKLGAGKLLEQRYQTMQVLPRGSTITRRGTDLENAGLTERQKRLIQSMRFDVVSFSRERIKRFVMTGGRTYREGDSLEGFTIDTITADGVSLTANGNTVLVRP